MPLLWLGSGRRWCWGLLGFAGFFDQTQEEVVVGDCENSSLGVVLLCGSRRRNGRDCIVCIASFSLTRRNRTTMQSYDNAQHECHSISPHQD
jgi:hypothetical protein